MIIIPFITDKDIGDNMYRFYPLERDTDKNIGEKGKTKFPWPAFPASVKEGAFALPQSRAT